jgi:hypothetical protein
MFEITNIILFYCNVNLPIASCEAYVFFLKTMKVIFFERWKEVKTFI